MGLLEPSMTVNTLMYWAGIPRAPEPRFVQRMCASGHWGVWVYPRRICGVDFFDSVYSRKEFRASSAIRGAVNLRRKLFS